MLDPHADRKFLLLHGKDAAMQHFKRIARAVPDSEHENVGILARSVYLHAAQNTVFDGNVGELSAEPQFCARFKQMRAHSPNDRKKPVAADMGFGKIADFFGRAEPQKRFDHVAVIAAVRLRIEFPVRKRARAAFAELHVGFGVERALSAEFLHVRPALFHPFAAFEQHWTDSVFDEAQRAEQPRRSCARDIRARRLALDLRKYPLGFLLRFIETFDRIHPFYFGFVTRVERFA